MLLLLLILSSTLAFFWPSWIGERLPESAPGLLTDPFLNTMGLISTLVTVTMFAVGMLLTRDEVRQVGRRWPTVLGGTTVQFLSMPLLAFTCARLFGLSGANMVGVVMVGCVPGAMASNVLTIAAGGNGSYSISLTTMATLASPLTVPIALYLTLSGSVDNQVFLNASLKLITMVVLPVICGFALMQLIAKSSGERSAGEQDKNGGLSAPVRRARYLAKLTANGAILWIIADVVGANRANLAQISSTLLFVLLLINGLGYLAGLTGGRMMGLPDSMRRALTLEVGMQNAGLGVALARDLFAETAGEGVVVAPAIYTFGCMLTGSVLAQFWSRRPPDA